VELIKNKLSFYTQAKYGLTLFTGHPVKMLGRTFKLLRLKKTKNNLGKLFVDDIEEFLYDIWHSSL